MPGPTGSTLAVVSKGGIPNNGKVTFALTGTYTAADFNITPADGLPFTPSYVRVVNLTDRNEMEYWVKAALDAGSNAKGLKDVAAGTKTYAAQGVTVSERNVLIDVSVAGPITDDDDAIIICEQ